MNTVSTPLTSASATEPHGCVTLSMDSGTFAFDAPGLRWRGFGPAAEILVGKDERLVRLAPSGTPAERPLERANSPLGRIERRTWVWTDDATGHRLRWAVSRLLERPGFTVQASFTNGSSEPIRLRSLILVDGADDALVVAGEPKEWFLNTLASSQRVADLATNLPSADDVTRRIWAAFNMPVSGKLGLDERDADGRWRAYRDWATLYTDQGARGLAIGATGEPLADLDLAFRVEGGTVRTTFASEMSEVRVDSGETRPGQELAVLWGPHDYCVEALFRAVAISHGARTHRGTAAGWCSWYHYSKSVSAADVLGLAEPVDQERLPSPVIQVDDGWQRQVGDWRTNERFAEGWEPVVAAIRQARATPGIWLAPTMVHESTEVYRDHPDWFQRDAAGGLVGQMGNWGGVSRRLDPSNPAVKAWLSALMRDVRAQGFTYVKIDFNTIEDGVRFHDPKRTAFQVLRDLYALYREALGEETYLLGCIGMKRAVCGLVDAARIGPDSSAIWRSANPCNIEDCIRATTATSLANGILWLNDPDVAYVKPRSVLSEGENRTWLGQVALLGGLALTSEPFHTPSLTLGTVTLTRRGGDLLVRAEVLDDQPTGHFRPWLGSCLEVFTNHPDGSVHQHYLVPPLGTQPACASHSFRGQRDNPIAEHVQITTAIVTPGGWIIVALFKDVAHHPAFAVDAKINCQRQMRAGSTAAGHTDGYVFTTGGSHAGTALYRPLADGETLSGAAISVGYAGTEDTFARMVPPAPEKARPWHGGWDREGSQIGFIARRPWGQWAVVQLHNPADVAAERRLATNGLESLGAAVHAWSFWDQRYLGVVNSADLKFTLDAHSPVLLRLTPAAAPESNGPVLVGSTLHYAQGAAEIAAWNVGPERLVIELHGAGSQSGDLYLASPKPLALESAAGLQASLTQAGPLWRLTITQRSRHEAQTLTLRITCNG